MNRTRRWAVFAGLGVTALGLSACGSSGTQTVTPTPVFAAGSATPGMPGMGAMPSMAITQAAAPSSAPEGPNVISITNFAFGPETLTVPVGTTVTWINHDEEPHTVASDDGTFHSPGMDTGGTYSFTFTKAGTYQYICSIHPFMKASVVVTP
ncbi:cupredoxin family copper-binding protein [Smaragdicoccus niigatensis]|uniref:cupredoxin domain-containing protein n=1 Tax=Smaragdicoccus niigatensis TaxID=359359 RepID=UPI0003A58F50|nr:cupredoxin family copper-binding protein [Smaragdicoccus niigatensis]